MQHVPCRSADKVADNLVFGKLRLRVSMMFSWLVNASAFPVTNPHPAVLAESKSTGDPWVSSLGLAYSCRRSFIFVSRVEIESMSAVKTSARTMPQAPQLKCVSR